MFAEVLPDEKSKNVRSLKADNKKVAMVGDGINDAPALAEADLGIAIGAGTDVAIETADVILVNSNPKDVLNIIKLSKASYRKMVENLIWAVGYNVIAIPLAAGVLSKPRFPGHTRYGSGRNVRQYSGMCGECQTLEDRLEPR